MPNPFELRGKRVLVVGLARTGVATALFCAERGAKVTATAARTLDWDHRLERQDDDDFANRPHFEERRFFYDSRREYRHALDRARGPDQRRFHHCGGAKQFSTGTD